MKKVNVGCGTNPMAGFLNTDLFGGAHVDHVCPAWDLPFAPGEVEVLHCHHVIEHLFPKDWGPTLAEFWRVLGPGGQLVISCPDFGEVARGYAECRYTIDQARQVVMATMPPFNSCNYAVPESYHRTLHSEASLREDLAGQGFEVTKTYRDPHYAWNFFIEAGKP
jgi:SAM-dependent methyltransferase